MIPGRLQSVNACSFILPILCASGQFDALQLLATHLAPSHPLSFGTNQTELETVATDLGESTERWGDTTWCSMNAGTWWILLPDSRAVLRGQHQLSCRHLGIGSGEKEKGLWQLFFPQPLWHVAVCASFLGLHHSWLVVCGANLCLFKMRLRSWMLICLNRRLLLVSLCQFR